jgi:Double-GTPase 2
VAEAIATSRCGRPDCEIATTGVCAEGLQPVESCPFFGKELPEEIDNDESPLSDESLTWTNPEQVPLPSGDALDVNAVDEFLRWRPAIFVAIVGERDSGKTTLISTIYDRYRQAPFAGHTFAGSRTLIGFEQEAHFARAESGLIRPETARTPLSSGLHFLHFTLVPTEQPHARYDLMLSDRAGEIYRQARSDSVLIADLIEVAKANCTVLLLDGERIANPVERAEAMQATRQNLRALLDGGALDSRAVVQVVTTKIDLLRSHPEREQINLVRQSFCERLLQDFGPRVHDLTFWEIAARAPDPEFEPALGVEALVRSWLKGPSRQPQSVIRPMVLLNSEFDRLLIRTVIEDKS